MGSYLSAGYVKLDHLCRAMCKRACTALTVDDGDLDGVFTTISGINDGFAVVSDIQRQRQISDIVHLEPTVIALSSESHTDVHTYYCVNHFSRWTYTNRCTLTCRRDPCKHGNMHELRARVHTNTHTNTHTHHTRAVM